ncbi:hypothetical protein DSO57_1025476 [Entomophthora muscae]|uniref:Uncharacterized protein n=1 Tax=Entomophthora muscae TaxID=34485 RepID=A0ACC2RGZ7_9FUNG|nr:hypothetical protein DSO57_1025476 [Entomophthora muscae]
MVAKPQKSDKLKRESTQSRRRSHSINVSSETKEFPKPSFTPKKHDSVLVQRQLTAPKTMMEESDDSEDIDEVDSRPRSHSHQVSHQQEPSAPNRGSFEGNIHAGINMGLQQRHLELRSALAKMEEKNKAYEAELDVLKNSSTIPRMFELKDRMEEVLGSPEGFPKSLPGSLSRNSNRFGSTMGTSRPLTPSLFHSPSARELNSVAQQQRPANLPIQILMAELQSIADIGSKLIQEVKEQKANAENEATKRRLTEAKVRQLEERTLLISSLEEQLWRSKDDLWKEGQMNEKHIFEKREIESQFKAARNQETQLRAKLTKTTDELERLRLEVQALKDAAIESKAKYDANSDGNRKTIAGLNREKKSLQERVRSLESELEAAQRIRLIRMASRDALSSVSPPTEDTQLSPILASLKEEEPKPDSNPLPLPPSLNFPSEALKEKNSKLARNILRLEATKKQYRKKLEEQQKLLEKCQAKIKKLLEGNFTAASSDDDEWIWELGKPVDLKDSDAEESDSADSSVDLSGCSSTRSEPTEEHKADSSQPRASLPAPTKPRSRMPIRRRRRSNSPPSSDQAPPESSSLGFLVGHVTSSSDEDSPTRVSFAQELQAAQSSLNPTPAQSIAERVTSLLRAEASILDPPEFTPDQINLIALKIASEVKTGNDSVDMSTQTMPEPQASTPTPEEKGALHTDLHIGQIPAADLQETNISLSPSKPEVSFTQPEESPRAHSDSKVYEGHFQVDGTASILLSSQRKVMSTEADSEHFKTASQSPAMSPYEHHAPKGFTLTPRDSLPHNAKDIYQTALGDMSNESFLSLRPTSLEVGSQPKEESNEGSQDSFQSTAEPNRPSSELLASKGFTLTPRDSLPQDAQDIYQTALEPFNESTSKGSSLDLSLSDSKLHNVKEQSYAKEPALATDVNINSYQETNVHPKDMHNPPPSMTLIHHVSQDDSSSSHVLSERKNAQTSTDPETSRLQGFFAQRSEATQVDVVSQMQKLVSSKTPEAQTQLNMILQLLAQKNVIPPSTAMGESLDSSHTNSQSVTAGPATHLSTDDPQLPTRVPLPYPAVSPGQLQPSASGYRYNLVSPPAHSGITFQTILDQTGLHEVETKTSPIARQGSSEQAYSTLSLGLAMQDPDFMLPLNEKPAPETMVLEPQAQDSAIASSQDTPEKAHAQSNAVEDVPPPLIENVLRIINQTEVTATEIVHPQMQGNQNALAEIRSLLLNYSSNKEYKPTPKGSISIVYTSDNEDSKLIDASRETQQQATRPNSQRSRKGSIGSQVASVLQRIASFGSQTKQSPVYAEDQNTVSDHGIEEVPSNAISSLPPPSSLNSGLHSTDDAVVLGITQAMSGEYLHKFVRSSTFATDTVHRRFFWLNPYTRVLAWARREPEFSLGKRSPRQVYVRSVEEVYDDYRHQSMKEDCNRAILIHTSTSEIRVKADSMIRHELWWTALSYVQHHITDDSAKDTRERFWTTHKTRSPFLSRQSTANSITQMDSLTGTQASGVLPSRSTSTPAKEFITHQLSKMRSFSRNHTLSKGTSSKNSRASSPTGTPSTSNPHPSIAEVSSQALSTTYEQE